MTKMATQVILHRNHSVRYMPAAYDLRVPSTKMSEMLARSPQNGVVHGMNLASLRKIRSTPLDWSSSAHKAIKSGMGLRFRHYLENVLGN